MDNAFYGVSNRPQIVRLEAVHLRKHKLLQAHHPSFRTYLMELHIPCLNEFNFYWNPLKATFSENAPCLLNPFQGIV